MEVISIIIVSVLMALVIYQTCKKANNEYKENIDTWYEILVHRIKKNNIDDMGNKTVLYSYEVEVKNNSTKENLFKKNLNQTEYIQFKNRFNIEPLEFVSSVPYYALYAHVICNKLFAESVAEYLQLNTDNRTLLLD